MAQAWPSVPQRRFGQHSPGNESLYTCSRQQIRRRRGPPAAGTASSDPPLDRDREKDQEVPGKHIGKGNFRKLGAERFVASFARGPAAGCQKILPFGQNAADCRLMRVRKAENCGDCLRAKARPTRGLSICQPRQRRYAIAALIVTLPTASSLVHRVAGG